MVYLGHLLIDPAGTYLQSRLIVHTLKHDILDSPLGNVREYSTVFNFVTCSSINTWNPFFNTLQVGVIRILTFVKLFFFIIFQ